MLLEHKEEAKIRLTIAAGRLKVVRCMVDRDTCCADLMAQLSAVQRALEQVQTLLFRDDLTHCVSMARKNGMDDRIIHELMAALKYNNGLIDGHGASVSEEMPNI